MPVWLHRKMCSTAARIYKTDGAKCLKGKHRLHYMSQLVEEISDLPIDHRETNFCSCTSCRKASNLGCTHPQKCLKTIKNLIEALTPKWRPESQREHVQRVSRIPAITRENPSEGITVDTTGDPTDLRDSIRIFTSRENLLDTAPTNIATGEGQTHPEQVIYTDGSCNNGGTDEARAGSGVWYGNQDPRNVAIRVPGKKQTNQIGELLAILHAIKSTPVNQPLRIRSDSRFAIDGLTEHAREWEKKDWIGVTHGALFKCTTAWIRARTATTILQWVKGHSGIEGNEEADKLAAEGSRRDPDADDIDLRIPANTMNTGAALPQTSQSLIYHHLTNEGEIRRTTTERTLKSVKTATKDIFGETPTNEAIWKSLRNRDVTKKVRDFLWKHMHGIYRLGNFWNHIPGCESRATCPLCNSPDTFEHIVVDCVSTEKKVVWEQANRLWTQRYDENLPLSVGAVLGGALANFKKEDGKPDSAKNRLYRILMTESTHLIWVLRCERRIANKNDPQYCHTEEAVANRWYRKINERMQIDCLLTNKYLYESKALKTEKVFNTWANCSTNKDDLHREWCKNPGFLVGKTSGRPPRQPG